MKHPKKTALAILLTLCLMLGLLPALGGTAYAADSTITWDSVISDNKINTGMGPDGIDNFGTNSDQGISVAWVSGGQPGDGFTGSMIDGNKAASMAFTSTVGDISKIVITAQDVMAQGLVAGWTASNSTLTWSGAASNSVTLSWTDTLHVMNISKIEFTIVVPSYTITLEPKNTSNETITEVTQGDTFNLGVKVGGGAFAGATVTIGYDATAFTAGDVTWVTGTSGTVNKDTTGKIGLVQLTTSEQADGTTIATIPFTAGTSATAQDYNFTVDSNQISLDVNDNTQTATATGATVTVKVAEAPKYDVTLSGATGNAQATRGVDYVATISEYDAVNYNYTVTATVGGSSVTPTISGATITIPGASVTGAVSITVTPSLSFTVNVYADYVSGWTLVTVKAPSGSTAVYTYDGGNLYNLARESAYGILVEGTVSKTTAEGKIALGTETLGEIPASGYDVNGTDKTDYSDVLMTYRVSQKAYSTPSAAMESYLRADVDGSHKVDMTDVNTVISNLSAS